METLERKIIGLIEGNIGSLQLTPELLDFIFENTKKELFTIDLQKDKASKVEPLLPINHGGWVSNHADSEHKGKPSFLEYILRGDLLKDTTVEDFKYNSRRKHANTAFNHIRIASKKGKSFNYAITIKNFIELFINYPSNTVKLYADGLQQAYIVLKKKGLILTSKEWDKNILG